MFKKLYLEPENKVFSEIMGNGKSYTIPPFQRDYAWEEEQLEELWNDIVTMRDNKAQHFMGYLVLQSRDHKHFDIIDGQQRLTTLSVLILAALSRFKTLEAKEEDTDKNALRRKSYHDNYVGVLDTVTLQTTPKLTLNRHNNKHFMAMVEEYMPPRQRGLIATNRRLNKTWAFFEKKIKDLNPDGQQLAELLNDVCEGLLFTAITVKDDLNAYVVFETLNARGMYLSAPDLFKNYLLSIMATYKGFTDEHTEDVEVRWATIIEQLGETQFTSFLRTHIGTTKKIPSKKDLYHVLKESVTDPLHVVPYLKNIERNAPVYAALQNPHDSFWMDYGNNAYRGAEELLEVLDIFKIKTPLSVLISAYNAYIDKPKHFLTILRWIAVISVRYNVICQKPSNDQEAIYNRVAIQLSIQPSTSPQDVKEMLTSIYPDDAEFKRAFAKKTMPSRQSSKKILYLLRVIEAHVNNGDKPPRDLSLEHVLPFRPDDKWQEAFGLSDCQDAIDRIGNMALLKTSDNMANESFTEKCMILKNSPYAINKRIADYTEWTHDTLTAHQEWLAKQAAAVWKI